MKLMIVRHGETDWNREGKYQGKMDIPLNDRGLRQAYLLGEFLSTKKVDLIFSSPLRRALDTAKMISLKTRAPIFVREELREIHFGEWEGLLVEEVKDRYPGLFEEWRRAPEKTIIPSGETLSMVLSRVSPFLDFLVSNYNDRTVLIVG
ncbi:MAG: Phosphoglycerate mutase, partial [bacterium 42_11]